jgi:hypothetical protein
MGNTEAIGMESAIPEQKGIDCICRQVHTQTIYIYMLFGELSLATQKQRMEPPFWDYT